MTRQLRAERTRATIITAAADLFDRYGYEGTSLADIVEHARVTKGALYFHFAAKEDLAHAILELQSGVSRQVAADIDREGYSSLEALMRITFTFTRLSVQGPISRAGLRLATSQVEVRPPLRHPFTEWRDIAAVRLHGAIRESDVRADTDVEAVAHSLVSCFIGTAITGKPQESVARLPRRTAEMWHLLLRGLVPVHRRPPYMTLTSRLEREINAV
ncbi:ScbR family autoregulator-binding transcription factor [Streptomyces sp. NPDC047017]|uniref:ScbR family autoregulator-binding transcription factor n=1 Tax=Streptomyces sp. NPDC047017 TaxID=3155024 RepID=UPI0033E12F40